MAIIDSSVFLQLADRLARQYQELMTLETTISPVATAASYTTVLAGANNDLVWTAVEAGSPGNLITIAYVDPAGAGQPLVVTVTGTAISVSLETDGGSSIVSTAAEIEIAVEAHVEAGLLVSAANSGADTGAGVVTAMAAQTLTGGLHGLYTPIILNEEDEDVAKMHDEAEELDENVTADYILLNIKLWDNLIIAMRSHFSAMSQSSLIDGFLTDEGIKVHQYFDTLHYSATSEHLSGANVFQAAAQDVAVIDLADTGQASLTVQPPNALAQITLGAVSQVRFDAIAPYTGRLGNPISVEWRDPAALGATLTVEVRGHDILVLLATDGAGAITSTGTLIAAAVLANAQAAALVDATVVAAGGTIAIAVAKTYLTNRNNSLTYTAVEYGSEGNEITVEYTIATPQAFAITVTGSAISVDLEVGATGLVVTTATALKALLDLDTDVTDLVTITENGTTTGTLGAYSATNLEGGPSATLTTSDPLGTGTGDAADGNYAPQYMEVSTIPAARAAFLDVYPILAPAFLVIDPEGATNDLRFDAVVPAYAGVLGNAITIEYLYDQSPSVAEAAALVGTAITVTLSTNAASTITSTANSIMATVNGTPAVAAVVTASASGGAGVVTAWPATNLSNARNVITYTADTTGAATENITITYVDPGGAGALAVALNPGANDIEVTLAHDGANITTIASEIVTAVNLHGGASALVTAVATVTGLDDGLVEAYASTNLDRGAGPNLKRTTELQLTMTHSDTTSVTRNVSFTAADPPATTVDIGAQAATVTIDPTGDNNAVVLTAVATGTAGNSITMTYVDPGVPNFTLIVAVSVNDITVTLGTDTDGRIISTADQIIAAIIASGPAAALVTPSNSGFGHGIVTAITQTSLAGGVAREQFYDVTAVSVVSGGEWEDQFTVTSEVERSITY